MSKVVDSLLRDIVTRLKSEEFHTTVVSPLLGILLDALSPYLFVVLGLWTVILLGVVAILGLLIQGRSGIQ